MGHGLWRLESEDWEPKRVQGHSEGMLGLGDAPLPAPTTCPTSAPAHLVFASISLGRARLRPPEHHSLKLWCQSLLTSQACLQSAGDAADTEKLDLKLIEF